MMIVRCFLLVVLGALFWAGSLNVPAYAQEGEQAQNAEPWRLRCEDESRPAAGRCEIYQRLVLADTGQRVSEFAIGFPDEDGGAGRGVIVLPLGVILDSDSVLQIDEGQSFSFRPRYCMPDGCYAFLTLNEDVLDRLKKGYEATVRFSTIGGQQAGLTFSLIGLTKTLRAIGR